MSDPNTPKSIPCIKCGVESAFPDSVKEPYICSTCQGIYKNIPRNVLRVVIQVNDTPENQAAMQKVVDAIKSVHIPDTSHSVIKAEQVAIIIGLVAKPANPAK